MALELSLACQDTDRNRPIIDGRVPIEGCRVNIVVGRAEEIFQRAFRHQEFDISELSLCTHLVTTARGDGPERSEERRVGKECYALCRSRWSPYH